MRQMTKMRLLVTAFLGAFISGNYLLLGRDWPSWVMIPLHILLSIGILTECAILFFSCFRVKPMDNGELCYDPENFWWKTMKKFYGDHWSDRIKICKSNWLTYGFVTVFLFCFAMASGLLFCIGAIVYGIFADPLSAAKIAGMAIGVLTVFAIVSYLGGYWAGKSELTERIFEVVVGVVVCFILLMGGVFGPVFWIGEHYETSIFGSVGIYFLYILGIVGAVALVYGLFKVCKSLKNTWLGHYIDENLCPELVACPLEGKCTE